MKMNPSNHDDYSSSEDDDCVITSEPEDNKSDINPSCAYDVLPLEVITTVESTDLDLQVQNNQPLKKLSNGVVTVRNIFSPYEKETLRKIVEKYRDIIYTKSRTREIYIEKQNVWEQIVIEYNKTPDIVVRTLKELKKCWDNMKYRAKQAEKEVKNDERDENHIQLKEEKEHDESIPIIKTVAKTSKKKKQIKDADGDSNLETGKEKITSMTPVEKVSNFIMKSLYDEAEPALKKARQEPSKSSCLLPETKKTKKKNPKKLAYSIPPCTEVTHIKKKNTPAVNVKKTINGNNVTASMSKSSPHSSMGNSNPSSIYLGSGVTLTSQPVSSQALAMESLLTNGQPSTRPLTNIGESNQNHLRTIADIDRDIPHNVNNGNEIDFINSINHSNEQINAINQNNNKKEYDTEFYEMELLKQKIEFEQREYKLKMKLLEQQIIGQTYQNQYWAYKLKYLKSEPEFNRLPFDFRLNGFND